MNEMKMMKTAARLDTFFKVMQRIIAAAMIVMVAVVGVLTVVNAVNPEAVIGEDFHMIDIGPITVELAEELAPDNGAVLTYAWIAVVLGLGAAAATYWAFGCIRKILEPMKVGDPFHETAGGNIKKVAYAVLLWGVVENAGKLLETSAALRYFNFDSLAAGGDIRSITVNYHFDLTFLLVFFLLLLVSYIFRYGTELQRLSDETL